MTIAALFVIALYFTLTATGGRRAPREVDPRQVKPTPPPAPPRKR